MHELVDPYIGWVVSVAGVRYIPYRCNRYTPYRRRCGEDRVVGDALGVDAIGGRLAGVLADLRDQLADFAAVRKKLAGLKVSAAVAEGSVEVTVNAQGQVIKTAIDECYLDDLRFLGGVWSGVVWAGVCGVVSGCVRRGRRRWGAGGWGGVGEELR
jgi:hypothetical protein